MNMYQTCCVIHLESGVTNVLLAVLWDVPRQFGKLYGIPSSGNLMLSPPPIPPPPPVDKIT